MLLLSFLESLLHNSPLLASDVSYPGPSWSFRQGARSYMLVLSALFGVHPSFDFIDSVRERGNPIEMR